MATKTAKLRSLESDGDEERFTAFTEDDEDLVLGIGNRVDRMEFLLYTIAKEILISQGYAKGDREALGAALLHAERYCNATDDQS